MRAFFIDRTRSFRENKKNFRPYYDRRRKKWRVRFRDAKAEEGSLLYVTCEFARTSLYFPFWNTETRGKEYSGHDHSFEGVLDALLSDPDGFSIEGFEEYYSEQARELLDKVRQKLLDTEQ